MTFCKSCGEIVGPNSKCKCGSGEAGRNAATFASDGNAPIHTQYTDAYVSIGVEADIEDGLRRMLDLRPEWVNKNCTKCGKECKEGALAAPYGIDVGKPYCKPCFNSTFSKGSCHVCHNPVFGFGNEKWVKQDGNVYHDQCYNEERRCHTCRQPIFGSAINALGNDYHEKCFQCGKCQTPLTGKTFNDFKGAPYCSGCYKDSKENVKIVTRTVDSDKNAANNAAAVGRQKELESMKQNPHITSSHQCSKCHKDMLVSGISTQSGSVFHPECFVCAECGKGFPDMRFMEKNGSVYHADCFTNSTAPKCYGCKQPMTKGKTVDYEGHRYHSECFTCDGCKRSLAGVPFGVESSRLLCEKCIGQPESKVVHGEHKSGFTVNPISGNKETRGTGGAKLGPLPTGLGVASGCPLCSKQVYMADKVGGPMGSSWHRSCLACTTCRKQLDSMAQLKGQNPYCRDCYKKA